MKPDIRQHLHRMVDECIYVEDLNKLLKSFIAEKEEEDGSWAKITICTHYMLGGESPHIERMAAATELIILALDIMDDLQDQDQLGKSWMKCPAPVALNAILALLMGVVGEWGQLQMRDRMLVEVSRIIARAVNGQQKDVTNSVLSVEDYLRMTQEKSGSLFRLACFMGYSSLDCDGETIEQVQDLADCIGLIHQIQNDMRDLVRWDVKNDLLSKKRTLPVLYLLNVDDPAFRPFKDYYEGRMSADSLLQQKERFLEMIHDSGCMEYSRVVQSVCLQKAEQIYEQLQAASPWKETFKELTYASFLDAM